MTGPTSSGVAAMGLACGDVLTDAEDRIVAEGRSRAYDRPGGPEVLKADPPVEVGPAPDLALELGSATARHYRSAGGRPPS